MTAIILSMAAGLAAGLALCAGRIGQQNRAILSMALQVDRLREELAETSSQRDRALTQLVINNDRLRTVAAVDDSPVC